VIDILLFLMILIQYSQRHSMINHCDRCITILTDTDMFLLCLIYLLTFLCILGDSTFVCNTLDTKEILKIYSTEQKIYPFHQDEWYAYQSDLSWYVSDCSVAQCWSSIKQILSHQNLNLFLPWYSWIIAHLVSSNNYSLTHFVKLILNVIQWKCNIKIKSKKTDQNWSEWECHICCKLFL
jgi:hypothetical protein